MSRPCKLQINSTGAWRDVVRFDIDHGNEHEIQHAAEELVNAADLEGRTTMRIVINDGVSPVPLLHWNAKEGWVKA